MPTSGLLAGYLFNGNTNDVLGANHATSNAISFTADRHGTPDSAVVLGASSTTAASWESASWVRLPQTFITALTDFTWCAWLNHDSGATSWDVPFSHGYHSGQLWYGINTDTVGTDGQFRQHWQTTHCDQYLGAVGKSAWYHLCVVGDRAAGSTEVFANGISKGTCSSMAFSASISQNITTRPPLIGAYNNQAHMSQQFQGLIDDVLFYSRQLTSAEIASIAAS
jgi:hypothetical protein